MDDNKPSTATTTNTHSMPSIEFFSSLPDDRRHKALRSTGVWALSQDNDKMRLHLTPHKGDMMLPPASIGEADQPIKEILDATPLELHGALIKVAKSTLVSQLKRLQSALEAVCEGPLGAAKTEHQMFQPYKSGAVERHVLTDVKVRTNLWEAAMASVPSTEVKDDLILRWKHVVRSEYLVSALKAHVRFEY